MSVLVKSPVRYRKRWNPMKLKSRGFQYKVSDSAIAFARSPTNREAYKILSESDWEFEWSLHQPIPNSWWKIGSLSEKWWSNKNGRRWIFRYWDFWVHWSRASSRKCTWFVCLRLFVVELRIILLGRGVTLCEDKGCPSRSSPVSLLNPRGELRSLINNDLI